MAEANGWRTNFYYQQELRSMEMNGIFNSSLTPGIYNADITIRKTETAALFNVHIAAGTTFVFSSRICTKDHRYYRQFADFSDLSKQGYYTIKATAETDVTVTIPTIGRNRELPQRFFLVASMPYGSVDNKDPIFKLARPMESTDKPYLEEIGITPESKILYDGAPDTTENIENSEAYLIVGEFIRTGKAVSTGTSEELNFSEFQNNYVFTRRGLEEYRYEYSADKNTPALDFGYTKDLDAIKVFWSTFMSNSILFKQEGSQRDQYGDFLRFSRASDIKLAADGSITKEAKTGKGVVYDFVFAAFQDTHQDSYDLKKLMTSHDYPRVPTLYSCKWIQDGSDAGLTNSGSPFILSESITPQLALLDRIAGRPILSRVTTAMKRGDVKIFNNLGNEVTDISPNSLSAIIPVALIMRPFSDSGNKVNKCVVGDKPKLNPDFVISYFDLYQGANECINIGLSAENIYSTVSVLD